MAVPQSDDEIVLRRGKVRAPPERMPGNNRGISKESLCENFEIHRERNRKHTARFGGRW